MMDVSSHSGTFREDIQRWSGIWLGGQSPGMWPKVRLIWTHQPLQATGLLRLTMLCDRLHIPVLPGFLRRLNITLHGLDVVPGTVIGGGFYMPHTVGTVITARYIGCNVTVVSNVTIGMRVGLDFPTIGNDVYIGAGARILGGISIGDGAMIGANAVVIDDVPAFATAVGVPAKILSRARGEANHSDV